MGKNKRDCWEEDGSYCLEMGPMILYFDNIQPWLDRAESFRDAAQATICEYMGNSEGKVNPLNAIGFLYRHSIELLLKAVLISGKRISGKPEDFLLSHSLSRLWKESLVAIEEVWPEENTKSEHRRVAGWIGELEKWDPTGFGFRYPSMKGTTINNLTVKDLIATCESLYKWLVDCVSGMLDTHSMQDEVG